MKPYAIEIEDVWFSYERTMILQEVNIALEQGEFLGIIGPNGGGKTTLLKIVAGLIPYQGEVRVGGALVKGPRQDMGFVFQQPVLLPWRTVLDNALLPVEVMGLDRSRYERQARELLQTVGLSGFADKYPFELSGGMQQRVSIIRALVYEPDVLLMDEPFGALDAMTREALNLELLRIWSKTQKTVLFVTHSISEAIFLSDRVVALTPRPGQIADTVAVNLPRPRHLEVVQSQEFGRLAHHIRSLLGIGEQAGGIE